MADEVDNKGSEFPLESNSLEEADGQCVASNTNTVTGVNDSDLTLQTEVESADHHVRALSLNDEFSTHLTTVSPSQNLASESLGEDNSGDGDENRPTQTDKLNKHLLNAFLQRLNNEDQSQSGTFAMQTDQGESGFSDFEDEEAADDPRVEIEPNGMQNWDSLNALDMDTMLSDVFGWIDKHKTLASPSQAFLIVEGFTIFNHRPLSNLCDKKFFLQVDRDTSYDRRCTRVYDPPDVPGYFSEVVWPMYLKNLKDIEDQGDIEYVDGLFELDTLFQQLFDSIKSEFVDDAS